MLCAVVMVLFSACKQDGGLIGKKKAISFNVSSGVSGSVQTKSSLDEELIVTSPDSKDTLYLSLSVGDLGYEAPATKGAPVTTESLSLLSPLAIRAYDRNGSNYFDASESLSYDTESGEWCVGKEYTWPETRYNSLSFWSWAHASVVNDVNIDSYSGTMSFSYTMPSADAAAAGDAVNQPSLVFAHAAGYPSEFKDGVGLEFLHALCGLRFIVGATPEVTIKSIAIEGAYTGGTCVYTPGDASPFSWTPSSATTTYTQSFNESVVESDGTTNQDLTDKGGKNERTFMLIPQSFSEGDVNFVMTFIENGKELVYRAVVPSESWKAGKIYTYRVNMNKPFLSVSVEDTVSANTKSDLKITNTGSIVGFVRAAIVANWYDASGNIVAPWDGDESAFTSFPGTGWSKGTDGFWYYSVALKSGEVASPLFNTYTRPTRGDFHLEMTIIAQIIDARGLSDCKAAYAAL